MALDIDRPEYWPALTGADRCDACGVRAVGRALLSGSIGTDDRALLLCGHHLHQHGPRIVAIGGLLVVRPDDTADLRTPLPRRGAPGGSPATEVR